MPRPMIPYWILAFALITGSLGMAQTTAKLSGVVTDESGAVIPNAQVSIKNVGTGVQRSAVSDARGQYIASSLVPGEYEITASSAGFQTLVQRGIVLAVGQAADINLKMKIGEVASRVEVTGEAPIVDTSTSAVNGVVEEKRIQDLPLNGRDFSQLALVQPGTVSVRNTSQVAQKGFGSKVSMAGSRPDQTAWLLDGTNIKGISNFGTPGSAAGLMMGVDAIREFQVLVSDYSAEFGFTSGGVVNMITKSGTNGLHGSAYEFLRNSKLDARNFFDRAKPAFKRNQFGASIGGPIKKDKAFFFGNYEGLRQRLGLTPVAIVPDQSVHQGIVGGQQLSIAPEIRPYLDLWPLPNGPLLGGGLGDLFSPASDPIGENYFLIRVDHHISDSQSIFSRFTWDQGTDKKPDLVPITNNDIFTRTRYTAVQYEKIFSPQLLATSRVAYNRSVIGSGVSMNVNYPLSLFIFDKAYPPNLTIPGATTFGPSERNIFSNTQNLFQFGQSLVYTRANQSLKFGVDIEKVDTNTDGGPTDNGTLSWGSISDFITDKTFDAFSVTVPGSTSQRTFVQRVYGVYFQDEWKMRRNLTVNLGVRYEPWTVPAEKWGRVSVVKDWVHATSFDVGVPFWQNPSRKNFSPRVGFSWDPKGDGKTAVRGGFGMFFVDMLGSYFRSPSTKNPPFAAVLRFPTPGLNVATAVSTVNQLAPSLLSPVMTPDSFMQITQWDLKPMYEMKFNFAIQRQLPGDMSLTIGYMGDRGVHGWRSADANDSPTTFVNGRPFVAAGTPRLNQHTGVGTTFYTDSRMFYNALQVEVKKRLSRGFQLQSSYTWSRAIDDSGSGTAGDFNGQSITMDPYEPKIDRGLSPLHLEHNWVINGTYALPSPVKSALASHLLGGWQLSSILSVSSGPPFNVNTSGRNAPNQSEQTGLQRPDLIPGRSNSNIVSGTTAGCAGVAAGQKLGTPTRYYDPCAFLLPPPGFYGNLGRDVFIGPGFASLDMSVFKSTHLPITEASRLEFRADFFNLANRANFAIPAGSSGGQVLNPTNRQVIASAGRITSTVGSARQLQFGLKVVF